jgi:hypothetical protein
MKFYALFLDGCPRLDITGLTQADVDQRAAKVIGGRELHYYKSQDRVKYRQVQIQVMV